MTESPSKKPILIFDGECSFCRLWIDYWRQITGDQIEYEPFQKIELQYPQISHDHFVKFVQLVTSTGEVFSGANAVFRSLAYHPGRAWMLWSYRRVPLVAPLSEMVYRFIAQHRDGFYKITRLLWGKHLAPSSYRLPRWLFLRLLGVIYLIAFLSLGSQILGLVGTNGILPAQNFLQLVKQNLGSEAYRIYPTLAWISSSDAFLTLLCWAGVASSLLLIIDIAPLVALVVSWVLYLSLFVAGQTFLSFQWDLLLLETGFLAIFLAPGYIIPRRSVQRPPSTVVVWLFRLLLFRLMFFSGFVKLASGDTSWHNLTTLTFHYETQPLPTPLAWYAHQLPEWIHVSSCATMFVIELLIPFFIFMPRRFRMISYWAITMFMVFIIITGNYTFFNFLTISICVFLLDDRALSRVLPRAIFQRGDVSISFSRVRRITLTAAAVVIIFLNGFQFARLFWRRTDLPRWIESPAQWLSPFSLVNHYGLFAVMTKPRYEIVVEGSTDGTAWLEYEFKYKPGDVKRSLPWVAPHQPRLDWQMWFAALGNYRNNYWLVNFCVRLLQGSLGVLGLIDKNPFPDNPPRYVRAVLYEYHFTDLRTRKETDALWKRELKETYLTPISLR